jgi:hypothetical protein
MEALRSTKDATLSVDTPLTSAAIKKKEQKYITKAIFDIEKADSKRQAIVNNNIICLEYISAINKLEEAENNFKKAEASFENAIDAVKIAKIKAETDKKSNVKTLADAEAKTNKAKEVLVIALKKFQDAKNKVEATKYIKTKKEMEDAITRAKDKIAKDAPVNEVNEAIKEMLNAKKKFKEITKK